MDNDFFCREVIKTKPQKWVGSVRPAASPPFAWRTMVSVVVLAAVWILAGMASASTPTAVPMNINDSYGVLQAMERGDIDALKYLSSNGDAAQQMIATVALLRATTDLERSSKASRECVQRARAAKSNDVVLICGLINAGNDLVTGRPGKWADKVAYLRQELYPSYRKLHGEDFSIHPLEYIRDPASFAGLPDATYMINGAGAMLPFTRFTKGPLDPVSTVSPVGIDVWFDDAAIKAILDTGSFMTLLNTPTAKKLNLNTRPGWMQNMSLAVVPDVRIGPLQARQVAVAVTSNFVVNVIGLDLIRQLGAIQFKSDGVHVLSSDSAQLASCHEQLRVGSALLPTGYRIAVPIRVDGKIEWAGLDTGASEFITRYGGPQPEADQLPSGKYEVTVNVNGIRKSQRRSVDAIIDVGDGPYKRSMRVEPLPSDVHPYYMLGLPGAQAAELLIDFRQRHLCTAHRSS